MKTDIKIYGIHKRDFLIYPLKNKLNLSDEDVIYDDRPNGGLVLYTFEKAFTQPIAEDITHRVCLPDDMIVCNNFENIINQMIETHPDKIIILFPFEFYWDEKKYKPVESPYIRASAVMGNGIVMPKEYINTFFAWVHETYTDEEYFSIKEEEALYIWAKKNDIKLITTIPSTVQHVGDDYGTTLPYEHKISNRKTKFFVENIPEDIDWNNEVVCDYPGYDYLFTRQVYNKIKHGGGKFFDEYFRPREVINNE